MILKKFTALLLVFCLAIIATACGGNTAANSASSDSNGGVTPVKDSVVIAVAAEPAAFFPFHTVNISNMDSVPVLHNIYETPLRLMPDGTLEPLLAESWDVSEDGMTYTLHLRKDVKFSDGNPMTAEDVAFSLNGAAGTWGGSTQLINFDNAEASDQYTVVIHMKSPYAPFIKALACRFALIVEKAYFDQVGQDGYNDAPIGTGPYKFAERVSGLKIVLEANENYWGGELAIKHVTFRIMSDVNTQMVALQKKEVDVILNASISPLVRLSADSGIEWKYTEASSIASMNLNCTKGPGADINFRKALQYGINKEDVILGTTEGKAVVADIMMTPAFTGRPEDKDIVKVTYDPEKAKQYLAASNYNGEEFVIAVLSGSKEAVAAQIIQGQLQMLGINCTEKELDSATLGSLVSEEGNYGGQVRSNTVSLVDADGLFMMGYHFDQALIDAGMFDTGTHNETLDALIDAGRANPNIDSAERKAIYKDAVNNITENAYVVPLFYGLSVVAYNKDLKGIEPSLLVGLYLVNDWSW